uniref:Uncharacterized protein n=1 Tax=Megaselia scalaris TaxID=36166 RepID=T1GXQ4_MEGSC
MEEDPKRFRLRPNFIRLNIEFVVKPIEPRRYPRKTKCMIKRRTSILPKSTKTKKNISNVQDLNLDLIL